MKKLINIFIVILFVLTLTVKADSSGPMFPTIKADLKNDAKCYDDYEMKTPTKTTFKKGQTITVRYVDGKRFELAEDDIEFCYVNGDDLIIGKNKYELTKDDRLEEALDLLIINQEGVQMYSGPFEQYEKLEMVIPKDTVIKTHYAIGTYWYYVTYNDVSGYISSEKNSIVHKSTVTDEFVKRYPVDDMDIVDASGKKVGTLPAKTELTDCWFTDQTRQIYLTYNDVTGFVSNFYTFASDCTGAKIKVLSDAPVYKNITRDEKNTMKKVGTATANKDYAVSYCFDGQGDEGYYVSALNGWLYFRYDDKIDYIETDKNGEIFDSREYREKHLLDKIEVEGYNLYFEKSVYSYNLEVAENLDKLNITYQPDYDDDVKVTITGNENLKNNSKVTIKVHDDEGDHTYTITIIKKSAAPTPTPVTPTEEDKNGEIIWICLGACLLIVITTIVIIILVNKKKKNKEVKEEVKVVPSSNVETPIEETSEKKELEEDNKNELED